MLFQTKSIKFVKQLLREGDISDNTGLRGAEMKRKIRIRKKSQTENVRKDDVRPEEIHRLTAAHRLQNSTDFMRKEIYN